MFLFISISKAFENGHFVVVAVFLFFCVSVFALPLLPLLSHEI